MKLVKEVFSASVKRFIASWCAMAFLLLVVFEKDFTMPSFAGGFSIVSALLIIGACFIFATLVRLFVKTDIFDVHHYEQNPEKMRDFLVKAERGEGGYLIFVAG